MKQLEHHEIEVLTEAAKLVKLNEIRVAKPAKDFCFTNKPLRKIFVIGKFRLDYLDCPLLVQQDMPGSVDGTHASFSDHIEDFILADTSTKEWILQAVRHITRPSGRLGDRKS